MRSSEGSYFVGLDHLRGLAAFIVFTWHFLHGSAEHSLPFGDPPGFFPAAILDEGHVGVALFMTLSGYLFAKLLDGRTVHFPSFFWNRFIRLFPLLALVVWVNARGNALIFLKTFAVGAVFPSLPNGGWSVTVEAQFYLVLPLMIFLLRKNALYLTAILAIALGIRLIIYCVNGEVEMAAYWTIIGRIDQFTLGIIAYNCRCLLCKRHLTAMFIFLCFSFFYFLFDMAGGVYKIYAYPSPSMIWLFMPTIEGGSLGMLIAYYDASFTFKNSGVSWFFARIGIYSYSIYLLQGFFTEFMTEFFATHVWKVTNVYVGILGSCIAFLAFLPIAGLSYHLFEMPFLRYRRKYLKGSNIAGHVVRPALPLRQSVAT